MTIRWNNNNYSNTISLKYQDKFKVLGEFINLNTSILHQCLEDNTIFYAKPKNLIKYGHCKECNRRTREKEFKEKLEKKHPHITLLEEYKTLKISRSFCCNKHNRTFVFKKVPSSVLNSKQPCTLCRKESKLRSERKNLKSMLKNILNIKENKASNCKQKEIKEENLERIAIAEETTLIQSIKKLRKKMNILFKKD